MVPPLVGKRGPQPFKTLFNLYNFLPRTTHIAFILCCLHRTFNPIPNLLFHLYIIGSCATRTSPQSLPLSCSIKLYIEAHLSPPSSFLIWTTSKHVGVWLFISLLLQKKKLEMKQCLWSGCTWIGEGNYVVFFFFWNEVIQKLYYILIFIGVLHKSWGIQILMIVTDFNSCAYFL